MNWLLNRLVDLIELLNRLTYVEPAEEEDPFPDRLGYDSLGR